MFSRIKHVCRRGIAEFGDQLGIGPRLESPGKLKVEGYDRVYHYHIRKTAGTSLNHSFLQLGGENSAEVAKRLGSSPLYRTTSGGLTYVSWNTRLINQGRYFYAHSHEPMHRLRIPERTYTFTCFRDPVERVLSHYWMLKNFEKNGVRHVCMKTEGKWLGAGFEDFLKRIPSGHLLNQIWMFSREFNTDEALEKAAGLDRRLFTANLDYGMRALRDDLLLSLESLHIRKGSRDKGCEHAWREMLREKLDQEYDFLAKLERLGFLELPASSGETMSDRYVTS